MLMNRYVRRTRSRILVQVIKSKRSFRGFMRFFGLIFMLLTCLIVFLFKFIQKNNNPLAITQNFIYIEPINSYWRKEHSVYLKKDYHDYDYLQREKDRFHLPGENGQPVYAEKDEEELNKKLFDENGYYGLISDKIALNRSVADYRHEICKTMKYLSDLPTVSIIIPFYNDHLSTLLRTVYSVINRSPKEILKEVILVNDQSTKEFLYGDLEDHIEKHLKHLVKLYVLPKRSGLIWARLAGARAATGDVLVFLDSHTEASTNFLPPLIEPIAKNYRICVCPFVDVIDYKTFSYRAQGEGARGIFDWKLSYTATKVRPQDRKNLWDNYENPVMVGGLFAISAKFFWELGGYDTGLDIWGGEQYELSFKIWLCGGKIYDTPCSRIGHVYRGGSPFPNDRKGIDFVTINYKRVAEVWMDEYKEYVYMRDPERYAKADTGDISYQLYIKERQKCKPFKYFIEEVAPDLLERYPLVEHPEFASGVIQSIADSKFCIDLKNRPKNEPVGLHQCAENKVRPQRNQHFILRYYRDIAHASLELCFDANAEGPNKPIVTQKCHFGQGNQYFRYDLDTLHIYHGSYSNDQCVEADIGTETVYVTQCDLNKDAQKWKWGFVNETNIRNWLTYGPEIVSSNEISELKKLWKKN